MLYRIKYKIVLFLPVFFYNKSLNNKIQNYKFVHVIFNDKFCVPFVDFINKNYNNQEHVFLTFKMFKEHPFPIASNVYKIMGMQGLDFKSNNIEKIIVHSLFWDQCVDYLYHKPDVLNQKCYWMIWGGDLYNAKRNKKEDFVRKGFKGYISDTDGDCDVVKNKYNLSNKAYFNSAYAFPITGEMVRKALEKKKNHDYIQIQINNSSDDSTLSMLDTLKIFANQNIKIVTILSYGKLEFKNEIISKGKDIFGDKFSYLDKYLSPEDYAEWLSNNDIYILNQNRQQGLGNSFVSLASGVKLFINSFVTTYNHFNDKGIKVYDTLSIKDLSYEEFCRYPEKNENMNNVMFFFDDSYLKKCWDPVFNYGE